MKSVATISVRIAVAAALSALALMPCTAGAQSIKEAAEAAVGTYPEAGQLRFSRRAIEQIKDGGEGRVEIAQTGATPIKVPRPGAGQTLTIKVVAGRPLKLAFNADDVKSREVVKDDLVLEFDNGGKIVLEEYMTAFGMLGEVRTTIIQPDGKHYAFTDLLSPTAGPRTTERPAPGTQGDVVIIQKPPAGETHHFKLTDEKPMALNFGFGQIAKRQVDKDGNLVLTFKDGAVLILDGYSALKDNKSIGLYFAKGDKIALADLAPGAGPTHLRNRSKVRLH